MHVSHALRYLAAGAVIAAAVVACNDATGPGSLANPAAVAAAVASVDSSFTTPVFASFAAVGGAVTANGPAAAAPFGALLSGTVPHLPGLAGRAFSNAQRARALQRLGPALSLMASPSGIFPDSVRGKTYTYDCNAAAYIRDIVSGADADGIRIVLYAVDQDGAIICPATAVGTLDIIDVGTPTVPAVRFLVSDTNAVTYVDYTVSGTSTSTSFTATVAGYVTDGTHRLDFSYTITGNLTGVTANATLDNDAADAHVALYERLSVSGNNLTFTIDYRISHGGETVRLAGSMTVDTGLGTVTAHFSVQAGGGTFATITATPSDTGEVVTFRGPGGRDLTADELDAIERLFQAPQDLFNHLSDLVAPAGSLVGIGV